MKRNLLYFLPMCAFLSIIGCGGGGSDGSGITTYSGNLEQVDIDASNVEQMARTATEGISAALGIGVIASSSGGGSSSAAPLPSGVEVVTINQDVETLAITMLPQVLESISSSMLPSAFQEEDSCYISGSILVTGDDSIDAQAEMIPESGSMTIEFRDCKNDEAYTLDGSAVITFTGNGGMTIVYQNFAVSILDPMSGAQQLEIIENLTVTCINTENSSGCTMQSDFTGSDGRVYRIADLIVNFDDVSAKVYDPDLGFVLIDTSSTGLDCPTGVPGSGRLYMLRDHIIQASVEYLSCSEFEVCLDSSCSTYTW